MEDIGITIEKLRTDLKMPFTTGKRILGNEYPEEISRIDGLLPYSGVALLCGPCKSGKSYFVGLMFHCITTKSDFLGKTTNEGCPCLYLALEDSERRLKNRFKKMKIEPLDELLISTKWTYDQKGIDNIKKFLEMCPSVKVIGIDTYGKFCQGRMEGSFQTDYDFMGQIKDISEKYNILIVFIHHTRKMPDENDIFNTISGSIGIQAVADVILLLQRNRNSTNAKLHITSRDFPEKVYDLVFDENCCWQMVDEAKNHASTPERQRILDILSDIDELSPSQIAEKIPGATAKNISNLLALMREEGIVETRSKRGLWKANKSPDPDNSEGWDKSDEEKSR
jgi:RecA-family ATPase